MITSTGQENGGSLPAQTNKSPGFFTRIRRNWGLQGYIFIAPWLIGFLAFGLWPLLNTFYNSFTKYNLFGSPEWIGLKNYINIFTKDPIFVKASTNMFIYVTLSTLVSIGGGLLLALILNRAFPGNHAFRTIFYLPSLLVGIGTAILFKQVFQTGPNGLVNQFFKLFGAADVNWLGNFDHPILAMLALILVNVWFMGGTMLTFLAGLKGISPVYYEAARIDGAGRWALFGRITLPLLSPVIVFNTIMNIIGHMQVFETPLVFAVAQGSLSDGNTNPLGYRNGIATYLTYIYVKGFMRNDFGYASALSIIVFLISMALALLVLYVASRYSHYGDVDNS